MYITMYLFISKRRFSSCKRSCIFDDDRLIISRFVRILRRARIIHCVQCKKVHSPKLTNKRFIILHRLLYSKINLRYNHVGHNK